MALLLAAARPAQADENTPPADEPAARAEAHPAGEQPTRSVWVSPTYQALFGDSFEPSTRHGVGASATYEFHISPRFNIGFALAYRVYPGSTSVHQLGYGAKLKHFFSAAWSDQDGVFPYLDYGLLLQQTFVAERSGSAVSHDTRLGGGAVVREWGIPMFIGVAGHYSRLQYFDTESRWIPYLEVELGWAHAF
ncbi:MAG TPA: hypothetical protein VMG12_07970 [Polyangiaceae bacterium]|nr:hypothetical protein [Polyangiaceae bacterium]